MGLALVRPANYLEEWRQQIIETIQPAVHETISPGQDWPVEGWPTGAVGTYEGFEVGFIPRERFTQASSTQYALEIGGKDLPCHILIYFYPRHVSYQIAYGPGRYEMRPGQFNRYERRGRRSIIPIQFLDVIEVLDFGIEELRDCVDGETKRLLRHYNQQPSATRFLTYADHLELTGQSIAPEMIEQVLKTNWGYSSIDLIGEGLYRELDSIKDMFFRDRWNRGPLDHLPSWLGLELFRTRKFGKTLCFEAVVRISPVAILHFMEIDTWGEPKDIPSPDEELPEWILYSFENAAHAVASTMADFLGADDTRKPKIEKITDDSLSPVKISINVPLTPENYVDLLRHVQDLESGYGYSNW
jgi:hypothetical protein